MSKGVLIEGEAVTRSQLYALVWQHEAEAIAKRCGFSGSLLGRVCRRWNIPKPGRGYWQQVEAGQTPRRLALPVRAGSVDPVVMHRSARGFTTVMPIMERPKRAKKESRLDIVLKKIADEQRAEAEEEAERQAYLFELITGLATRHVLAIQDWQTEHSISMALHPAPSFDDTSCVYLDCRYVLPQNRCGTAMRLEVRFLWRRQEAGSGPIADRIGYVDHRKREILLFLAEDAAATIHSALAAGRLRMVNIEVVRDGRRDTIRWAKLSTRTHDEVSVEPGKS